MNTFMRISILLLVLILFVSCSDSGKKPPVAKNGVLDLRSWDLEKDGTVEVKGEWEFYWDKHLKYDDFHSEKPPKLSAFIDVPGN